MRLGLHAVRLTDCVAASALIKLGALQGEVMSVELRRQRFDAVHNDSMGHLGVHATLHALRDKDYVWVRMSREVAQWIAECPTCQKYRVSGKEVITIPSPIASFQIFEELD